MDVVKTIETPYSNAVALVNRLNEYLIESGIMDSNGTELAQLDVNPANPGWLFALACGNLHTSWQERLSKAYAALDSQSCEEDQVLVLAAIAGLQRGNGTPAHITVSVRNDSAESITIPAGTIFDEDYSGHQWALASDLALAGNDDSENSHSRATLYCTVDGNFYVPADTDFDNESLPTISVLSQAESSGGTDIESIASLRNRISQGKETADSKTQAETAIATLSGVETCSIWFNPSSTDNLVLEGGISVPPRNAYVCIKGVDLSGKIAETYFSYLDVPATIGDNEELYQRGQQPLSMKYDRATEVTVKIFVKMNPNDMAEGAVGAIKRRIVSFSGSLKCGENLTAQKVSEWIQNLGYGTVIGCNVGASNTLESNINANEYAVFGEDDIEVN